MTVILGCISCVLVVAFASFVGDLASGSALRMRAQTAADAAALAAVAEGTPHGSGEPYELARRYAELNGARLVDCTCERGAAAVQVEVAVDDIVAEARAELDSALLAPAPVGFDPTGLDPVLRRAVARLIAASEGRVSVVSGYRSHAEQSALWDAAVARYGSAEAADDWVARPGHSMHERGLAVDLGGDVEEAAELVRKLGLPLHRPLANEPWHFELAGSRG